MQGLGKKFEFRLFMSNMKVRCGSSVFFTRVIETWEAGSSNLSDSSDKCYSRCSGEWAHHVAVPQRRPLLPKGTNRRGYKRAGGGRAIFLLLVG